MGLGAGGLLIGPSANFLTFGAGGEKVGKSARGIAKTAPRAGGQKKVILSGEGPPTSGNDTIRGRGVCSHSRADSSRCGHSPDSSVAHNNEAGVCQGGGGRGAHQPNPRTHQQFQM